MNLFDELIIKYRSRGVLIDSNLLLLLVVGSIERALVTRFKRTRQFTVEDFDLLVRVVAAFRKVLVTPHVLAEVSNLANALEDEKQREFFWHLARLIECVEERHIAGRELAVDSFFDRLGVTDTAIILATTDTALVLTVDFPLASCIAARNGDVFNFNHLRIAGWQ